MKKLFLIFTCCLLSFQMAFADKDEVSTDTNRLPAATRQFIHKHFPNTPVSHLKIESNLLGIQSYDVILTNGFDLEFDAKGNWTEIDGKQKPVPVSAIPPKIAEFQKNKFPKQQIVSIEKRAREYEIKLSNEIDVIFDLKYNFVRYDD